MDLENLFELIEKIGLKQNYIENAIGANRGKITDWKSKRSTPKDEELEKLSNFFGVTKSFLIGKYVEWEDDLHEDYKNAKTAEDKKYILEKEGIPKIYRNQYINLIKINADTGDAFLDKIEEELIAILKDMNTEGKEELLNYAKYIKPKYIKSDMSPVVERKEA